MDNKALEIARRLAGLRDACGYTADGLADELGIDRAVYSAYEENGEDIPISVLFQVANKFGVDFNEILTGDEAKLDTYHVVRAGTGKTIQRYAGYDYRDIAFRYTHKIMQPLLVTLQPDDKPAELVTHVGQEFNYVLSGTMVLTYGDKDLVLAQGDSVYFNPTRPHGQRCSGSVPAVFLTVIAE
ncbi:MAG: cupin domain-containing protein [Oscillospiraceae bacterium]|jgi:mannose-6-phosphate isomerase-like protein (cupin superfamily)/DNA-binding XRE family transcriptional regulator|nr:cupin domain-containing protein [Oscillospiraceae bacterium]